MDNAQNCGVAYAGHGSRGLAASRYRPSKALAICRRQMSDRRSPASIRDGGPLGDGPAQNKLLAKVSKGCGVCMAPANQLDSTDQTWPLRDCHEILRRYFMYGCADQAGVRCVGSGSRLFKVNVHLWRLGAPSQGPSLLGSEWSASERPRLPRLQNGWRPGRRIGR